MHAEAKFKGSTEFRILSTCTYINPEDGSLRYLWRTKNSKNHRSHWLKCLTCLDYSIATISIALFSFSWLTGSPNNCSLIWLLGQELFKDYFSTGEDGNVLPDSAVGGAADVDENQACALDLFVDTLLLQASNASETAEIPSNSVTAE